MHNQFFKARIKLTAYYSAGVLCVVLALTSVVYIVFTQQFLSDDTPVAEHRIEEQSEMMLRREATERLLNILIASDVVALLGIIAVSYFLSRKTLAPIQASYERQQRLLGDVAHELRTPLAVMKAGSEVTLSNPNAGVQKYRDVMGNQLQEINHMSGMVSDLLYLAQKDEQDMHTTEVVDFSQLCKSHSAFVQEYADSKNIALNIDIDDSIAINASASDIRRIIMNLVKNAIDYNRPGGTVSVGLHKEKNKAVFMVRDTGIGIAKKDIHAIFDRFYKVDVSRSGSSSGSGLGLALVKEIVERYQGTIAVESKENEGTTFTVVFPLA